MKANSSWRIYLLSLPIKLLCDCLAIGLLIRLLACCRFAYRIYWLPAGDLSIGFFGYPLAIGLLISLASPWVIPWVIP
jgi:hypothetical protein